ncbi:NUDIX hydrolase [Streptomyces sp. WMMC500]|uniref:NUDIX hydrolase n=1 Tax=Streptomyces sp. WMMC500 TaxID=3015154 RepID=UPI00248AB55D|nr:NUDIX hydrolase [Streptomyces sp. WMMC500]WBB58444.1 NUDIX hydrolase [Streptomyces sp. WMMC500]
MKEHRTDLIRAAGCVLWRTAPRVPGGLEIALVHRPKYDDWSHPKGKLKQGEEPLAAALREVAEETGMACEPGVPLPTTHYRVADGRPKEVRYWAARTRGGAFVPNDEVDRVVWLPPDAARRRLSHGHDRALVDALLAALPSEAA